MKPIIVIPAYNPDDKLIHLIEDLTKLKLQCVVVNDGSNQDSLYYEMNFLMVIAKAGKTFMSVPIESIYIDENKSSHLLIFSLISTWFSKVKIRNI